MRYVIMLMLLLGGAAHAQEAETPSPDRLETLREAALSGDAEANYQLARYLQESGSEDKFAIYINFYTAADSGHAPAQFEVAELLRKGEGIDKDEDAAKTWYLKSADQGHGPAMIAAARMLSEPWDWSKDLDTAEVYALRAQELGEPGAEAILTDINNQRQPDFNAFGSRRESRWPDEKPITFRRVPTDGPPRTSAPAAPRASRADCADARLSCKQTCWSEEPSLQALKEMMDIPYPVDGAAGAGADGNGVVYNTCYSRCDKDYDVCLK